MSGRPNCRNKAAFLNSSGLAWTTLFPVQEKRRDDNDDDEYVLKLDKYVID